MLSRAQRFGIISRDKNFGIFGRFFVEISFSDEPRKEKCMENSIAGKIE